MPSAAAVDPLSGYHCAKSRGTLPAASARPSRRRRAQPLSFPAFAFSFLPSPLPLPTPLFLDAAPPARPSLPGASSDRSAPCATASSAPTSTSPRAATWAFILARPSLHVPVLYFALMAVGAVISPPFRWP
ncbi:hypothetical protein ZWY2020_020602 [Hordeum vulgare]|nr:hypothetical protein ZWY2020_020602 [Hordeum vulgare]